MTEKTTVRERERNGSREIETAIKIVRGVRERESEREGAKKIERG